MYQQICAYTLVYPACKTLYNIYCIAEIGKVFVSLHMNYKYKCDNDRKITYVHCM